ncbi:hypothetical protein M407DRAFT_160311 [Tulasnella calospora MUT 4182]|uniref:Uncharacterized protein n=1 Tax=Tulasnella calospora MUT 4182 TaxID=1051891 RepID=A0A0C3Q5K5_9AGAM|nr:hypothetical protein M407DRAFT_160311 [Tulasnella calospora MUT 4182]
MSPSSPTLAAAPDHINPLGNTSGTPIAKEVPAGSDLVDAVRSSTTVATDMADAMINLSSAIGESGNVYPPAPRVTENSSTQSSGREEATSVLVGVTRRGRFRPPDLEEGGEVDVGTSIRDRMRRWREWGVLVQQLVLIFVQVTLLLAGVVKLLEMTRSGPAT